MLPGEKHLQQCRNLEGCVKLGPLRHDSGIGVRLWRRRMLDTLLSQSTHTLPACETMQHALKGCPSLKFPRKCCCLCILYSESLYPRTALTGAANPHTLRRAHQTAAFWQQHNV